MGIFSFKLVHSLIKNVIYSRTFVPSAKNGLKLKTTNFTMFYPSHLGKSQLLPPGGLWQKHCPAISSFIDIYLKVAKDLSRSQNFCSYDNVKNWIPWRNR